MKLKRVGLNQVVPTRPKPLHIKRLPNRGRMTFQPHQITKSTTALTHSTLLWLQRPHTDSGMDMKIVNMSCRPQVRADTTLGVQTIKQAIPIQAVNHMIPTTTLLQIHRKDNGFPQTEIPELSSDRERLTIH